MSKNNTDVKQIPDELSKTFLSLVKACRNLAVDKDGNPIIQKGVAGILKEAREWVRQNHLDQPNAPEGSALRDLEKTLAEIPAEWDEVSISH
jgi:hypothetical protein